VNRSATAETFAGTVVVHGTEPDGRHHPVHGDDTRMSVRVYSPAAGIRVR